MSPIKILFVEANPPDTDAIRTTPELRDLQDALKAARFGAEFTVIPMLAARGRDLLNALAAHQPHILHFAVHGDGDGLLLNHPSDERSESLPGDDLLRIVRTHQDAATQRLHLVVMPDCYTAHLAEVLGDVVDAAVGMTDAVEDAPVQQVITPVFYRRLADGTTVANALAAVDAELRRQGLETAAEMVRVYPKTGGQVKPLDWNTTAPEPLTLSPHHRQYLAQLCGAMKRVNLANILETQRREPELLDIYVPLPVDAELVLVVRDRRAADWWIDTSDGHERDPQVNEARLAGLGRAGEEMGGRERPKTWPALRLDAGDLAPLVQYVRGQMAQQIAEERDARFGRRGENALRWRIDVEQAASLQPRMVLIGDPGSGKSSFLRHLALCLAGECLRRAGDTTTPGRAGAAQLAGWLAPTDLTPIYIELRALVADFPPLPEPDTLPRPEDLPTLAGHFWPYVQATVLDARLAAFEPELATLCLDGRAILLLDGLDEVSQAESPERRQQIHHLIQQLTDTYPKLRIVVGSRPYAYEVGDWALDGFGVARLIPLPNDRLRRLAFIAELDAVLRDARAGYRREFARLDLDVVDGFLAQHAGLLTLVSPRPNHYRFLHASFQEYLAACELTCPAPAQRVPPVAPARHFPAGLLHYARSRPDGWWNATHLAADQLLATGRSAELWSLLAELCAPYVAGEDNARAALLAMAVINTLPAGTLPGTPVSTVVTAAARLLADVKHVPLPAQRLTAGDALVRLGDPRPGVTIRAGLPDIAWCEIPEFDSQGRRQFLFNDGERDTPHPGLPPFWVAKYPITYAQFQAFVDTPDGYPNREWRAGLAEYFGDTGTRWEQRWPIANRPRENVSWSEAVAFCRWLTAQARLHLDLLPDDAARAVLARGGSIRLPTEQEWVKAARGFDDRLYPWGGQEYREGFANVDETKDKTGPHNLQETSPVGLYPHAASPFGAEEMSGCVWEYCLNKYADPADLDLAGDDRRAVRGGSWYSNPDRASVAARDVVIVSSFDGYIGFRVVCAASPSL